MKKIPKQKIIIYYCIITSSASYVCVCGRHFQQIGHQPGMVANPARCQLNKENRIFPVPVRA